MDGTKWDVFSYAVMVTYILRCVCVEGGEVCVSVVCVCVCVCVCVVCERVECCACVWCVWVLCVCVMSVW